MKLPSHLKSILREYNIDTLHFQDDIVIQRILQFGEIQDYKQLEKQIGKQAIIDCFLQQRQHFDKKTINFWEKIFHLPHLPSNATSIYEKMHHPTFRRSIG
jgi:cell fate (sporulation/competence/biofilm development) regulator YmcA (YheA/YmcA/DUF963 family)